MSDVLRALTYVEGLLAKADPELFECACKGGDASELLPVDIGEMFVVSNTLRAALAPVTDEEVAGIAERNAERVRILAQWKGADTRVDDIATLLRRDAQREAELAAVKAERYRAQRACEQMGARITSLEAELVRLREVVEGLTDCQPVPKVYKYTGTAEVDVENMFDVGHRHKSGKQPRDYLMSWLSMFRPFAYATKDDSWGELEKLISIVMNNYVQILVRAEAARAALEPKP